MRAQDRRRAHEADGVCSSLRNTFTGQGLYFLQQQGLKITTATNISLGCLSVSAIVFLLGGYVMERVGRRVLFVYFQ